MLKFVLKTLRISDWWNYIFPPILGVIYLIILHDNCEFGDIWLQLVLFFISFVFTASFGFYFNDVCDINVDKKAGKRNFAADLSNPLRYSLLFILIIIAILPWFFLNNTHNVKYIFLLQVILLFLYSFPYTRFKDKYLLGIVSDALYSSLLPSIIAILLFFENWQSFKIVLFIIYLGILFLRGLRNILIHQIFDMQNDSAAKINTFVIKFGKSFSIKLIKISVICEVLSFLLPIFIIPVPFVHYYLYLLLFSVIYYMFKLLDKKNKEKNTLHKIQFVNDIYEDIIPLFLLILLTINDYRFGVILVLHVLLFNNKVVRFIILTLFVTLLYGIVFRKTCGIINRVFKTNF
jgi:4-hydroxybenzoate polyprenyltransferase